jgi:hypothetical protein
MKRATLPVQLLFLCFRAGATDVFQIQEVADVVLNGSAEQDNIGIWLDGAGDVNGDGLPDILLGTDHTILVPGATNDNFAYIIMGATDLPATIELGDPPPGNVTVTVSTSATGRVPVAGLGDFNGDGYDDVILGNHGANPGGISTAGQAFILYGTGALPSHFNLENPGLPGVMISGYRTRGFLGASLSRAGDVNADGFMDAIVGAPATNSSTVHQEAFIIYGGTDVPAELVSNNLGSRGVRLIGKDFLDTFGTSVAAVGDVNRDGFGDLAVGASSESNQTLERAYIIYGGPNLPALIDGGALGDQGVLIQGPHIDDAFGVHVSGAGDVNDDGYDDMLVGAHRASPDGVFELGQVYLVFGGMDLPGEIHAATLDGLGLVINGSEMGEELGAGVSGTGDVNHDGIHDFSLATYDSRMYIIFGGGHLTNHSVVSSIESFDRAIILDYWNQLDPLGLGFANLGDVSGDGVEDLLIGDFGVSPNDRFVAGRAYLVYGSDRFRSMRQRVDLNHDNVVDSKDLFIFSREWKKDLR